MIYLFISFFIISFIYEDDEGEVGADELDFELLPDEVESDELEVDELPEASAEYLFFMSSICFCKSFIFCTSSDDILPWAPSENPSKPLAPSFTLAHKDHTMQNEKNTSKPHNNMKFVFCGSLNFNGNFIVYIY